MIHKIRYYGDPVLRLKAREVKNFDKALSDLIKDMFETMEEAGGVGLAAPQMGISQRILVIDLKDGKKNQYAMINPQLALSGKLLSALEGCLSIPGINGEVSRPSHVHLEALDPEGRKIELEAEGLLARALQHEVDHLDGIFYVDRLSSVRRSLISGKLKRLEKDYAAGRTPEHIHEDNTEVAIEL